MTLRLRNERVTQAEFDRLPWLLSRFQFKMVTGLSSRDLAAMVKAGEIRTFKRKKKGYAKYYKADAATICGFKM